MAKLKTFLLEVFIFIGFLFIGAAVFQALEEKEKPTYPHPSKSANPVLVSVINQIRNRYNITETKMNTTVEELRTALRKFSGEEKWQEWSFVGSYYFAGTVAFTIGNIMYVLCCVVLCCVVLCCVVLCCVVLCCVVLYKAV